MLSLSVPVSKIGAGAQAMALSQAADFDIAILDVNLQNEMVSPVADLLQERGIPLIFTTGYVPEAVLPARFMNTPATQKPYENEALMLLVEQAFTRARAQHKTSA
jgi:DNA-binding NtrC family response regulator